MPHTRAGRSLDPHRRHLALAQLRTRLRGACRAFRQRTGFSAVFRLVDAVGSPSHNSMSPPIHPRCASRIRSVPAGRTPCRDHWQEHVRESLRSHRCHTHTCRLGLHCSCVPIYLGDDLVGVAKMVVDSATSPEEFSAATATLALAVSRVTEETRVSSLSDEVLDLRTRVSGLQRMMRQGRSSGDSLGTAPDGAAGKIRVEPNTIVHRAVAYLHLHYTDRGVCLGQVARALQCNGNYLTQRFTRVVGQRMHGYLVALRVEHACRQLLRTELPIKHIAYDSGFRDSAAMARAFRRHVGVRPGEYRRAFVQDPRSSPSGPSHSS